jgi:hypothetical protein
MENGSGNSFGRKMQRSALASVKVKLRKKGEKALLITDTLRIEAVDWRPVHWLKFVETLYLNRRQPRFSGF